MEFRHMVNKQWGYLSVLQDPVCSALVFLNIMGFADSVITGSDIIECDNPFLLSNFPCQNSTLSRHCPQIFRNFTSQQHYLEGKNGTGDILDWECKEA